MKKTVIMILICIQIAGAGNSKILSTIQDLMPNFQEIGFITNLINVYFQVSQFVRSTNEIVKNMKQVKNDIQIAKKEIQQIYSTCKSLKHISLYDMDTWSSTVQSMNWIISHEVYDVIGAFSMLEYHTVDATVEYMDQVTDIKEFDYRKKKTEEALDKYFLIDRYADELKAFNLGRGEYYKMTLTTLQNQYTQMQIEYVNTGNEQLQKKLNILERRIMQMERKLQYIDIDVKRMKIDTIIEEAKALVAINLVEIQEMEKQVKLFEEAAATMIESYNKLCNNQVSTKKNKGDIITEFKKRGNFGSHANQVEEPAAPETLPVDQTLKKEITSQDIVSLQNGIAYMLLKQECLIRDITAMRCNTMAFILILEAFVQDKEEMQGVIVATNALYIKETLNKQN